MPEEVIPSLPSDPVSEAKAILEKYDQTINLRESIIAEAASLAAETTEMKERIAAAKHTSMYVITGG